MEDFVFLIIIYWINSAEMLVLEPLSLDVVSAHSILIIKSCDESTSV